LSTQNNQPKRILLRPWGGAWQRWVETAEGNAAEPWKLDAEDSNAQPLVGPRCLFVLPARTVCSVLAWVPQGDDDAARESAQLQMEVAGMVNPQTDPAQLDVAVLLREESRSLARGLLFPPNYETQTRPDFEAFLPSPLALKLPSHALCLWLEGSSLVVCLTGENAPMIWESCPVPEGSAALRGWLETFLLELRASDFPVQLERLCDFSGVVEGASLLGLDVEKLDAPAPMIPSTMPAWLPPAVLQARRNVALRQQWTRALTAAGAALFILGTALAGYLISKEWQLRSLRAEVDSLSVEVEPSIAIARQWELLSPSIDPSGFALEKLLLAVSALPADGVRLSLFEALPDSIRIEGDARNVGLATLFFNSLQAREGAENYSWNMPPPVLQPDNTARFAIDGTRLP
jgi:hypothetical protein